MCVCVCPQRICLVILLGTHHHLFFSTLLSSGTTQNGFCGRCDGIPNVDTLGVYEFDTESETIIGSHVMEEGVGGDPFPSPDGGKFIYGKNASITKQQLCTHTIRF